jgi:hypothetical protein
LSFPFDLHSAAVFDSHIPCRSGFILSFPFDLHIAAVFDSHIPCRSGFRLSFPFDLHIAAVFHSNIPCRSLAMPRICRSESDLSRPQQDRGRGTARERHGIVNRPLLFAAKERNKGKGKVHHGTGHEGPEGKSRYNCALSLT